MAGGGKPVCQGQTDEANNMMGMRYRPASSGEEVDEAFFKLLEKMPVAELRHLLEGQFGRTSVIKTSSEF